MKKIKKIIHVARQQVQCNVKNGTNEPSIIVRSKGKSKRFHDVEIIGKMHVIQRMDNPLSCGARIWIETNDKVIGNNSESGEKVEYE